MIIYLIRFYGLKINEEKIVVTKVTREKSAKIKFRKFYLNPYANSVSPLKIAAAYLLIHAIHKKCIVYLFL